MPIERIYHDNGVLRWEGELIPNEPPGKGGIPNGVIRTWHPNGVLESETPFDHGLIDGVAKQWNDKGELLGTSDIKMGTGIDRHWHANGQLRSEWSLVDGATTGRERLYWETGELLRETYYIKNVKVSKKRYIAASENDPSLPRYDDEATPPKRFVPKKAARQSITSCEATEDLASKLLSGTCVREAMSWLEDGREPSRTLGEFLGQDDSIDLVKKLYRLGAVNVHAVEIQGEPAGDQNTGRLVVELPDDSDRAKNVLKYCGHLGRELGFDPEPYMQQRYTLVMLD